MSTIEYDHGKNIHGREGPGIVLHYLFEQFRPDSILDIGCGEGTWLAAAQKLGIQEVFGIDGVEIASERLLFPHHSFKAYDLTQPLQLGRRFGLAICLEVAEHLPVEASKTLVDALTTHADAVLFSAACPGQNGQNHVNCQWPGWWQSHFNANGFTCDDSIRWSLWEESVIEPWYRQNMFFASRDEANAGREPRIAPVIHPDVQSGFMIPAARMEGASGEQERIRRGEMCLRWYLHAAAGRLKTRLGV